MPMEKKSGRVAGLERRVAGLEGRVAGMDAATQQRLARLEAAFEALWRRVDELEDEKKKNKGGADDDDEEDEEEDDEEDEEEDDKEDDDDQEDKEEKKREKKTKKKKKKKKRDEIDEEQKDTEDYHSLSDDEEKEGDDEDSSKDKENKEDEKKENEKKKSTQIKEVRNDNDEVEFEVIETDQMRSERRTTIAEGTPPAENERTMNEGNEPTESAAVAVSGDVPESNAGVTLLKWMADCRRQDDEVYQTAEPVDNASLIDSLFPLASPPVPQQLPPLHLEQLLPKYQCHKCGLMCRSGAGLSSHMRGSKCPGHTAAIAASPSVSQAQPQKAEQKASSLPQQQQKQQQQQQQHRCPDCGLACESGAGLASHMRGSKCPGRIAVPSFAAAGAFVPASPRSLLSGPQLPQQPKQQPEQPQQQYKCPDCGRICESGAGLASHRRGSSCPGGSAIAINSTAFPSPSMTVPLKPQLQQQQQQQQQQYKCPDCGRSCESGAGLASHRRGSTCPGNTTAPSRKMTFGGSFFGPDVTQLKVPSPSPPPQEHHQCPHCGRSCASAGGLASHMRGSQCPGQRSVTYRLSSRSSSNSYGGGWGGGGGGGGYSCPNCGRVCASGAGLASHMRGSRCS